MRPISQNVRFFVTGIIVFFLITTPAALFAASVPGRPWATKWNCLQASSVKLNKACRLREKWQREGNGARYSRTHISLIRTPPATVSARATVTFTGATGGKFLVLGARTELDHWPGESLAGKPYLWAAVRSGDPEIPVTYLQGDTLMFDAPDKNIKDTLWGIFPIPEKAEQLELRLGLAEINGEATPNISVSFRDVGVFVAESRKEAEKIAKRYAK